MVQLCKNNVFPQRKPLFSQNPRNFNWKFHSKNHVKMETKNHLNNDDDDHHQQQVTTIIVKKITLETKEK